MKNKRLNFVCPFCGEKLAWESDANQSDVIASLPPDDSSIISYYSCQNCGCSVEVYECEDEEKINYPFWAKRATDSVI